MKTIFLFIGAFAISNAAIGQAFVLQTSQDQAANQSTTSPETVQGGVVKKGGKMYCVQPLSDSIAMDNGMVVYMNGTYKTRKGKSYTLDNGGRIDFLGAVEDMNQRINEDSGMVMMDNGSVWVWRLLMKPMQLSNGNYVLPDGRLQVGEGNYVAIDDKTFIDFDGNLTAKAW
jgi:hypothetical protein